jgi:hypothetical protein
MTPNPGEIYYIERHIFLECIGQRDAEEFVKTRPLIPGDKTLRLKYYSSLGWDNFKERAK